MASWLRWTRRSQRATAWKSYDPSPSSPPPLAAVARGASVGSLAGLRDIALEALGLLLQAVVVEKHPFARLA